MFSNRSGHDSDRGWSVQDLKSYNFHTKFYPNWTKIGKVSTLGQIRVVGVRLLGVRLLGWLDKKKFRFRFYFGFRFRVRGGGKG